MLWRLNHAIEKRSKQMEAALGVTFQQRTVLRLVGRFPGMTAGALSSALHVDPGTVSAALRRLEGRGLVERRQDPRDGRRILLGLTEAGRALDVPGGPTIESAVERTGQAVGRQAIQTTEEVLARLVETIDADAANSGPPRRRKRP